MRLRRRLEESADVAWREARLRTWDDFDGYAELLIQYGYVTFFSMAFPLAPVLALVNNVIAIRFGAIDVCYFRQRPKARKSGGIGVWLDCLRLMTVISVITNCAHVAVHSSFFKERFAWMSEIARLLVIIAVEHVILTFVFLVFYMVPSKPSSVAQKQKRDRRIAQQERLDFFSKKFTIAA